MPLCICRWPGATVSSACRGMSTGWGPASTSSASWPGARAHAQRIILLAHIIFRLPLPRCLGVSVVVALKRALGRAPLSSAPRGLCRYHTGCGFYINSALVFAAITATIWVYLLLALTGILTYPCGPDGTQTCSTINGAPPRLRRLPSLLRSRPL